MLNRYPHSAQIFYATEIDSGSGIPTTQTVKIEIPEGRYDPVGQDKDLDYSAKFYCPNMSTTRFQYDGAKLVFSGKQFNIINLFEYQTHVEIWLE